MAGDVRAFDEMEIHQDVQKWVDPTDFGVAIRPETELLHEVNKP
jgi:hypothetical protein